MPGELAIGQKDKVSNTFHLKNLTAVQWTGIIVTSIAVAAIAAAALSYFGIGSHLFSHLGFLGANPELYTVAVASLALCGGIIAISKGKKSFSTISRTLTQTNKYQEKMIKKMENTKAVFDKAIKGMYIVSDSSELLLRNSISGEIVEPSASNMDKFPEYIHVTVKQLFQEKSESIFRLTNGVILSSRLSDDVKKAIIEARTYIIDLSVLSSDDKAFYEANMLLTIPENKMPTIDKGKIVSDVPDDNGPIISSEKALADKDAIIKIFNDLHKFELFFREKYKIEKVVVNN